MNLEQITDTLNSEFKKEGRRLVFWYDEKQEFLSEIEELQLENAKLLVLREDELFKTKILLERQEKETNYLIYAPFKRSENRENHLADTIMYSKVFLTDWISIMAQNLKIDDELKGVMEEHRKFFEAKDRREKFEKLVNDSKPSKKEDMEIILMRAITGSKAEIFDGFEDVTRILITDVNRKESRYLSEFKKYSLEEKFWDLCRLKFGYIDDEPNLTKLLLGIFLTYVSEKITKEIPKKYKKLNVKSTVIIFLNKLRKISEYRNDFENLVSEVYSHIKQDKYFKNILPEHILELDIFDFPDEKITEWIAERICDENFSAKLQDKSIIDIIKLRQENNNDNDRLKIEYKVLKYAYNSIKNTGFNFSGNLHELIKTYDNEYYWIDTYYRKFYYYYDKLVEKSEKYEKLAKIIELKYTDDFLNTLNIKFNELLDYNNLSEEIKLQKNFYKNYVEINKNRIVVIISDAFRYEVAKELVGKMNKDEKMNAEMESQMSILPSITKLGMASLLPHEKIEIKTSEKDFTVLVDGKACNDRVKREKILKEYDEDSVALDFDKVFKATKDEVREMFRNKKKVYIYHNQIDARGDKANTEDEVFEACHEALDEIMNLVKKLRVESINNIIVTSDHGFIYKRRKIEEFDKIENSFDENDIINKRYVITEKDYDIIGVNEISLSNILNNENEILKILSPNTSNIFKISGGGQNYYHGGISLQEMMVPVVKVRTAKGAVDTEKVKINLISEVRKITSLAISLEFLQKEAVTDIIKSAEFEIFFTDGNDNIISNIENYKADSEEGETKKRIRKFKFTLKNQKYSKNEDYYLIVKDKESEIEEIREKMMIDVLFADDFGF